MTAFGRANRRRLLDEWFDAQGPPTIETAWQHVYRLLLWIDKTTGLAHCYESDKSQPGRPWYGRSLAFHAWVAQELGTTPLKLGASIDWLFRRVLADLSSKTEKRQARAERQLEKFGALEFPDPGEDPDLEDLILDRLSPFLSKPPPREVMSEMIDQVLIHIREENKRKNLVGEGFEDVLEALVTRLGISDLWVDTRVTLHDIHGFHPPRAGSKAKKVDLALMRGNKRILVTAKWSVRADREEQFATDFDAYARLESANEGFDYILVTNEFDPARLSAACDRRIGPAPLFTHLVHVCPDAVKAVYDHYPTPSSGGVYQAIDSGRLIGLGDWLSGIAEA